jgi:hypothetical protein
VCPLCVRQHSRQRGTVLVQILTAEFLWIDTKGVEFKAEALGGLSRTGRYPFMREALDELDALSLITMASQVAWENERSYTRNPHRSVPAICS